MLEKSKVNEIYGNTNSLKETVHFLSEKFHKFEANRQVKEEKNNSLRGQVSVIHDNLGRMQAKLDEQAQYSRWNCLLFHGIKEEKGEDTGSIIINTVNEKMNIEILPNDLDWLHCIGNSKTKKREKPIIVKI